MKAELMKSIPYGNAMYEVTADEYMEWEDRLDEITNDQNSNAQFEWITYQFLMDAGVFVSAPQVAKPDTSTLTPAPVTPRYRTSFVPYEEPWGQAKVLQERERNLRERERLLDKQWELEREKLNYERSRKRIPRHIGGFDFKIYNKDGSELSIIDIVKFVIVTVFILWVLLAVLK